MHRSGTSAITRGLQVLGVNLGDALLPAIDGVNDKGFWEDIHVLTLNIEILSALGWDWHHLRLVTPADVEALQQRGYVARAVELLQQKVGGVSLYGFKDPRMAKLLPFWKVAFGLCDFDISYVLALRHPMSVAKSLAMRNSIDAEKCYQLWLGHVLTSLGETIGARRVLVDYDLVLNSPEHEIGRIGNRLDLPIDPIELQHYKNEFLDQRLRHTHYGLNAFPQDDACPPLVREVYAALLDVARDYVQLDAPEMQSRIFQWAAEFNRSESLLMLADRFSMQIAHFTQAVADRDNQIAALTQVLMEHDDQIARLKEQLAMCSAA